MKTSGKEDEFEEGELPDEDLPAEINPKPNHKPTSNRLNPPTSKAKDQDHEDSSGEIIFETVV
jgi:hypothetical protein